MKKITVLGGGTGSIPVLSGLKKYEDIDLKVIVNMTDDGGSNAVVRDQFGLLPLSDLRKSILALSKLDDPLMRDVFTYRFEKGDGLKGHTLGNLILMGLSEITGSEKKAIKYASEMFGLAGMVLPVTFEQTHLVAEYTDGTFVKSEHLIDEPEEGNIRKIKNLSVEPRVPASHRAVDAIIEADYIILGPGDLYTTTLANIVIDGMKEAFAKTNAKIIFIMNLMTKKGQTHDMKGKEIAEEVEKYIGKKIDMILFNNGEIPEEVIKLYEEKGEQKIESDFGEDKRIIKADIIGGKQEKQKGDDLVRSFIRHDAEKLSEVLYKLCV